jgi:hypothetical protein
MTILFENASNVHRQPFFEMNTLGRVDTSHVGAKFDRLADPKFYNQ